MIFDKLQWYYNFFFKRWSGSVWQKVYMELLMWSISYTIMSLVYRLVLTTQQQNTFSQVVVLMNEQLKLIPLNFMLGFFVSSVVNRWTKQFENLGYIDNLALLVTLNMNGTDLRPRLMRRNIIRYCCLSQALVFRDIHSGVRKRFPCLEALVTAGIMQQHELELLDKTKSRYAKYWLPLSWALETLNVARKENFITSDSFRNNVATEIKLFNNQMSLIWSYDWNPLPFMYPQLITLSTNAYFWMCIVSRQYIDHVGATKPSPIDLYVPIMSLLEFICYIGWLKVAMALLNPFGEDDEDFDCNYLIDRNLAIGLTAVDESHSKLPEIKPDMFLDDVVSPLYSKPASENSLNFFLGGANAPPDSNMSYADNLEEILKTKDNIPCGEEILMIPHPMNVKIDEYLGHVSTKYKNGRIAINNPRRIPRMDYFSKELAGLPRVLSPEELAEYVASIPALACLEPPPPTQTTPSPVPMAKTISNAPTVPLKAASNVNTPVAGASKKTPSRRSQKEGRKSKDKTSEGGGSKKSSPVKSEKKEKKEKISKSTGDSSNKSARVDDTLRSNN